MTVPPIHPVPYGETVTLRRTSIGNQDEYGNDVLTEATVRISNVPVWPDTRFSEDTQATDRLLTGLTLLIPPGLPVYRTDRFTVRSEVYEVIGEPAVWRSYLTGTEAGTQVFVQRVEG